MEANRAAPLAVVEVLLVAPRTSASITVVGIETAVRRTRSAQRLRRVMVFPVHRWRGKTPTGALVAQALRGWTVNYLALTSREHKKK